MDGNATKAENNPGQNISFFSILFAYLKLLGIIQKAFTRCKQRGEGFFYRTKVSIR